MQAHAENEYIDCMVSRLTGAIMKIKMKNDDEKVIAMN